MGATKEGSWPYWKIFQFQKTVGNLLTLIIQDKQDKTRNKTKIEHGYNFLFVSTYRFINLIAQHT
jgi:hypothetical protein